MAGRPKKPIEKKRLEGDTRQRGQQKFDAMLAAAVHAKRGRPKEPAWLNGIQSGDPVAMTLDELAADYWERTADGLAREGLLATIDEGMLTAISYAYAAMVMAGRTGSRVFPDMMQRYMQAADRMGLNESARAKFQKPQAKEGDPGLDAMAAFLGTGDSAVC